MLKRIHITGEGVFCLLLLTAIPFALAYPMCREAAVPMDLRAPLYQPPWEDGRPESAGIPQYELPTAGALQYYPFYRFMNEAGQRRFLPLWYPLEGLGAPFLAAWKTRALSPFSLPVYFMPLVEGLQLSALLKLLAAGYLAFYAARRLGLAPLVAFFAAVTFQCSAGVLAQPAAPMADAWPWLPLLLLSAENTARAKPRCWVLGAFALGIMLLSGAPAAALAALVLAGLHILLRNLHRDAFDRLPKALASFALLLLLAFGVAATQLLPYLKYSPLASTMPGNALSFQIRDLLNLIQTSHLGGASLLGWSGEHGADATFGLLYAGAPAILLLPVWFAVRSFAIQTHRRLVESGLIAAALLAVVPFLTGGKLPALPGIGNLDPAACFLGVVPALAVAAATALQYWLRLDHVQVKAALRRLLILAPLGWGIVITTICLAGDRPIVFVGSTLAAVFVLMGVTLLKPNPRLLLYPMAALAVATLCLANFPRHTPAKLVFPSTEMTASLSELDGPVGGSHAIRNWPLAGNGISQVQTPAGLRLKRFDAFLTQCQQDPRLFRNADVAALLFTREDIQGEYAELRPFLNIQTVYSAGAILFRDIEAKPRARVVHQVRAVTRFNPADLSTDSPPLYEGPPLADASDAPDSPAEILPGASPNRVTLRTDAPEPGILVLTDAYYPEWEARVDGQAVAIHPVDGVLRGVPVAGGNHEVTFTYRTHSLYLGAACTLVSLLILFLAGVLPRRRSAHTY